MLPHSAHPLASQLHVPTEHRHGKEKGKGKRKGISILDGMNTLPGSGSGFPGQGLRRLELPICNLQSGLRSAHARANQTQPSLAESSRAVVRCGAGVREGGWMQSSGRTRLAGGGGLGQLWDFHRRTKFLGCQPIRSVFLPPS